MPSALNIDLPFQYRGANRTCLIQAANWTVEQKKEFDQKSSEEQQMSVIQQRAKFLIHEEP